MDDKLLILAETVGKLKAQVQEISSTTAEVSKKEGPQGIQGPMGATGKQGPKGERGERGADGVDGKDGQDGEDGISVVDSYIAADNSLVLLLSDGNEIDAGPLPATDSLGQVTLKQTIQEIYPAIEVVDISATVTLPTVPTVFVAPTIESIYLFEYDSTTGIVTVPEDGAYTTTIKFNAQPSSANKNIYYYLEVDDGTGWQINTYSGRQLELVNNTLTESVIVISHFYSRGSKLRMYIWGDATIGLHTINLPGTVPGTVVVPAFRLQIA